MHFSDAEIAIVRQGPCRHLKVDGQPLVNFLENVLYKFVYTSKRFGIVVSCLFTFENVLVLLAAVCLLSKRFGIVFDIISPLNFQKSLQIG